MMYFLASLQIKKKGDIPDRWNKTDDSEVGESNVFSEDRVFLGRVLEVQELS